MWAAQAGIALPRSPGERRQGSKVNFVEQLWMLAQNPLLPRSRRSVEELSDHVWVGCPADSRVSHLQGERARGLSLRFWLV